MYFWNVFISICTEKTASFWKIMGIIIKVIMIGVPVILIAFGTIDLIKAISSKDEKKQKEASRKFGKKFLNAVIVFAVIWVSTTVIDIAYKHSNKDDIEPSWKKCWSLISNDNSCYYCTANNTTSWSALEPGTSCPDGWKKNTDITKDSKCNTVDAIDNRYMCWLCPSSSSYKWDTSIGIKDASCSISWIKIEKMEKDCK